MRRKAPLKYPSPRQHRFRALITQNGVTVGTVLLLLVVMTNMVATAFAAEDPVAQARSLAYGGKQHWSEALALLQQRLAQAPDDIDARVLYGTVLSWERHFDEAREQLSKALAQIPDYEDALLALANVELWSGNADRAEQLAQRALVHHPKNVELLLTEAEALEKLNRRSEALKILDRIQALDPANQQAKNLRREISALPGQWEANITHFAQWFSNGPDPQHETWISLKGPTRVGPLLGRLNRADRYSISSYQMELELYPQFRPGTYAYVGVGYSPDANLYPRDREGVELYQSVPRGFELSGGYRRLSFGGGVNIATFSVAKYYGSWLFTTRGYLSPSDTGMSGTGTISARHFFSDEGLHNYIEFAYSRGASPALANTLQEFVLQDSSLFAVELDKVWHTHWATAIGGGIAQEERVDTKRYYLQGSVYYRL